MQSVILTIVTYGLYAIAGLLGATGIAVLVGGLLSIYLRGDFPKRGYKIVKITNGHGEVHYHVRWKRWGTWVAPAYDISWDTEADARKRIQFFKDCHNTWQYEDIPVDAS